MSRDFLPSRLLLLSVGALAGIAATSRWGRVFVLLAAVAVFTGLAYRRDRPLLAVLLGAFGLRLVVIFLDVHLAFAKHPPISPAHNLRAIAVWNGLLRGELIVELPGKSSDMRRLVALLIAPFYGVFGDWPIAGRIAIGAYSIGVGAAIYGVCRELVNRRLALGVAAATLVWPSILYRSVFIQREIIVAAIMLCFLWLGIRLARRQLPLSLLLTPLLVWIMFVLRPENLFIVGAVFVVALLVRNRRAPRRLAVAALLSVPVVGYLILNFGRLTGFGDAISPRTLNAFAQARAKGTTAYLVDLQIESWLDVALYFPIKVFFYLFMPLPWEWTSPQLYLMGLNGVLLFVVAAFAIRGFGLSYRDSPLYLVPATFVIVGVAAYALIELNYAAAFRRRIQFTPVILMFAALRLSYLDLEVTGLFEATSDSPTQEATDS